MMVTNRDFVMARAVRRLEDGTILSNHRSVVHPDCGDCKGFVRGDVFESGYYIKPNGNGGCTVVYVVQIDPKGVSFTLIYLINFVLKIQISYYFF